MRERVCVCVPVHASFPLCKDHRSEPLKNVLCTICTCLERKQDNKAFFLRNSLVQNELLLFIMLHWGIFSLYWVFSRMIMLNGVYYKQNAPKIWRIIQSVSNTRSRGLLFPSTSETRERKKWEKGAAVNGQQRVQFQLILNDTVLPFIQRHIVYVNRLKTAPIHAC